jgi:hypothetical protein
MFESVSTPASIQPLASIALTIWALLLIPWLFIAALAGMVFEGGGTAEAYVLAWSIWMYPVLLAISFFCALKRPYFVLLPILSLLGIALSGFLHKAY